MTDAYEHIPGWFKWAGFRLSQVSKYLTLHEAGRTVPYIPLDEVEKVTGIHIGTHIHQQQCIVAASHPEHLTPLGVYDNVAYYYRCLGNQTEEERDDTA